MTEPVSNPYKLVPVKPTLAMILAATDNCSPVGCCSLEPDHAREIWEAMLAASPQGESEWITHDGGPNPVPGKMVDAELGCGVFVNCLSDLLTMFWPKGGRYRVTEGVKP